MFDFPPNAELLPRQERFASLHILTRRASEGSEALPSLARRVRMSFFGARVIAIRPSLPILMRWPWELTEVQDALHEVHRQLIILDRASAPIIGIP